MRTQAVQKALRERENERLKAMRGDLLPGEASTEGARVCEAEDEVDGLPNHGLSPDSAKL